MLCLGRNTKERKTKQKREDDLLKKDILVQQLVNSFGNWVRTDCENREGGTARMTKELYPYPDQPPDGEEPPGHGAHGQLSDGGGDRPPQ